MFIATLLENNAVQCGGTYNPWAKLSHWVERKTYRLYSTLQSEVFRNLAEQVESVVCSMLALYALKESNRLR